jgi:hypothetical protein
MEKKNKKKYLIFNLSGLFIILSLMIFSNPLKTFGQTTASIPTGSPCQGDANLCQTTYCNSQGYCAALPIVGSPCNVADSDDCVTERTSFICIQGKCGTASAYSSYSACVATSGNSAATCCQSFPNDPSCTSAANTTGSSGTGTCPPNSGLTFKNGLCLPPNQFTTGIASQTSLTGLLIQVIQFLLDFAGIIAVVVLIVGGFWYITSSGNEEQAEKGKKAIINAIIGLVVVVMSYAIVTIISGTLISSNYLGH